MSIRSGLSRGTKLFYLISLFLGLACTSQSENQATQNLSSSDKMRYNQYIVYGQQLYKQNCSNCHQEDGTGLGKVIPPLVQADYMLSELGRTACIIKYGLEGEIEVNGTDYNQIMPAHADLTALEIAQIITYIGNSWGNEAGYVSVKETESYLDSCMVY